jgi:Na+-driven multidrug efflux pump
MLGGLCYFFAEKLAKIILNQSIVSSIYVIENDNQLVILLRIFSIILPFLGIENFLNSFLIALGKEKLLIGINFLGYYGVGVAVWNYF